MANVSNIRIKRIKAQGYFSCSNDRIAELAFGNRFAFILCTIFLGIGIATANLPILTLMMVISFFGVILPYHPFDYIYNLWLRKTLNKPELPQRSKQLKFACTIAAIWLGITIYLFQSGLTTSAYISGAFMFGVAFLNASTDFCIPSAIYNFLFRK